MRNVVVVVFPGVQVLDAAGPHEVFALAGRDRPPTADPPYRVHVASLAGGNVATSNGMVLGSIPLAEGPAEIDTLIVPGGSGVHAARQDGALIAALRARADGAGRVASVCTGAFLLGELGLLDGRAATTHWASAEELRRAFPAARVAVDPIFVQDGRVWTSAGVTAGMDLALALVRADLGAPAALAIARWLVMFVQRPGGQAQFSLQLRAQAGDHGPLDAVLGWMGDHLHEDLGVPALALRAGMSERNFARVFKRELGVSPARYVERLRVEAACRDLEDRSVPVQAIADRRGFGTVETLERSFRRALNVTPGDYRRRFHP